MATRERLEQALRNADKAGDVVAAKRFAAAIRAGEFDAPDKQFQSDSEIPEVDSTGKPLPMRPAAQQPAPSFAERAMAVDETLVASTLGGLASLGGQAYGSVKGIGQSVLDGTFGTNSGANQAEQVAASYAQKAAAPFQPQTALGGEYTRALGEASAPLAGLAPFTQELGIIGQSARAARPQVRAGFDDLTGNTAATQAAEQIASGSRDKSLAKFMVDPATNKRVKDEAATQAIKQGFDEALIQSVKQTNPSTQQKLFQMADIAEKSKNDAIFGASNRPLNVLGDSLIKRVNYVQKVNKEAGEQLDGVAQKLKGQKANIDAPLVNFIEKLDGMGVRFDKENNLNFKGSDIEGVKGAEEALKKISARLTGEKQPDAYELHRLKRYIDELIPYGQSAEGLTGKAEGVIKTLRRDIDQSLDSNFPEYNEVNTRFADTIGALDEFQQAAGSKVNLKGENADKALGRISRRLTANAPSGVTLIDSIKSVDQAAAKYGAKFDDDIMTQAIFADELDRIFGASAKTSLQGDVGKGVRTGVSLARGDFLGAASDAVTAGANKVTGRSEQKAFQSIKRLLSRDAQQ